MFAKRAQRFKASSVNDYVYVRHNLMMLDKWSDVDYERRVIAWTEGVEEVEGWVDAWQEAREGNPTEAGA
eukprot:1805127-Pyramimonas_sp.AAC.1